MKSGTWKERISGRHLPGHSIRHRIVLIFIGVMAAMLLAIWAVNNWWLERYYQNQKLAAMEQAYGDINEVVVEKVTEGESIGTVITQEILAEWELWGRPPRESVENHDGGAGAWQQTPENREPQRAGEEKTGEDDGAADGEAADNETPGERTLLGTIRSYGDQSNISTVLIDSVTGKVLLGFGRESDFLAQKVQRYVFGKGGYKTQILKQHENYVVETNYDYRSNSTYMESWGFFSDNRTLFIMSMPLSSIRDSVQLSNRFTTCVGLVVLVFGSVLMYFVTNQVTRPIMKLATLSERMSNLDFDVSYEDDAQDEIGVLGRSMNTLSDKLKETIGALQEANRQLQHDIEEKIQIDEMRKDFIANVSHELKTPIALIQGYAEGLMEGMCEDEESRNDYCEVIVDEAGKMNKMVRQLLTLTALEFGNDTPVLEPFELTELVRDLISASAILVQQNNAHVEYEAGEPIWVVADEFKIEEVLTNYLTNAMNHLDGERNIRIRTEQEGAVVTVRVFNTGKPIPQEDLPNLWTKFYKVDKARTRAYGGSGIGLSIVKAIMDAHHQRCGVDNVEDGVEFWFTLEAEKENNFL